MGAGGVGVRKAGAERTAADWCWAADAVKGKWATGVLSGRYLSPAERAEIAVGLAAAVPVAGGSAAGTAGVEGEPGGSP
jgi:hypothetical protein